MNEPRPGDILVLHTPDGLRFQLVKGVPEGDEAEVLAAAIDRVEAWDKSQELGPWVTNTRPGIGVPVIRVAVPGLRHLWARFAPGRLYDVPVQLGWRSRPIAARRLNPIPLMI